MNEAIAGVRLLHIAAGILAFVVAPAVLIVAKDGAAQHRWDKLYFWALALVAVTAILLAVWRPAVLSLYSAFAGYRVLYRGRTYDGKTSARDWRAAIGMLSGSAVLFALGVARPNTTRSQMFAIVLGLLGMALAAADFVRFTRSPRYRRASWFSRMSGMLGSYVATVSAVSAVTLTFLPLAAHFQWPSVPGLPLISVWVAYYRARFARRMAAAASA